MGLTCWKIIQRGPNKGKLKVTVCVPTKGTSPCVQLPLMLHEFTHVRDVLALKGNNGDQILNQLGDETIPAMEERAYRKQCELHALMNCIPPGPARDLKINECVQKLLPFSTEDEGRDIVKGGCGKSSW